MAGKGMKRKRWGALKEERETDERERKWGSA